MNLKRQTSDLLCNYHHWTVTKKGRKNNSEKSSVLSFTCKYQGKVIQIVQLNYSQLEDFQYSDKVISFWSSNHYRVFNAMKRI